MLRITKYFWIFEIFLNKPSETLEFIKMQILELVLNFLTSVFKVSKFDVQSYQILNVKFFQMMLKAGLCQKF